MKIGFIHEIYPAGGAEKVTSNMGEYLAKKNYKLYVFTSQINEKLLTEVDKKNFTFIKIDRQDLYQVRDNNNFFRLANENGIDILINVSLSEIQHAELIKNCRARCVFSSHGTPFWEVEGIIQGFLQKIRIRKNPLSRLKYKYIKLPLFNLLGKGKVFKMYQNIYNSYDVMTVLCEAYKKEIEDKLGIIEGDSKIEAIPNGMFPAPIKYSLDKKKQVLYLGRMSYADKRIDRLIEIWRRVYRDFPEWEFILVGDGSERENLQKLSESYKLERIRFVGSTNNPYHYYNEASILCMTSQFEGTPLALVEAQQAGVIPMAFNCSEGVASILSPSGENGILIPDFDMEMYEKELRKLMSDEVLRRKMQPQVIRKSEEYKIEVIGKKWECLFESILQRNKEMQI